MKKLLVMLTAALMIFGLSACGNNGAEIKAVTEAVQGTTANAPATTKAAVATTKDEEEGLDNAVVVDDEGTAEGGQDEGVE